MATTSIHPIRVTEAKSVQYITNPEKAERITCYGCNGSAEDISHQFDMLRAYGKNTGSVLSYHIIQSFAPNEATAEQVHQAGLMLCDKLFQGKYKYVLATHTDTEHIHNHIIFCKTNMENYRAFSTLMDTKHNPAWKKIRQLSDEVCKEMGLSVVEYGEIGKGVSHYEWSKQQQSTSWKAKLRYELDCIIQRSDTFEEFLEKCRLNGMEVVYNPDKLVSLKFRMQGQQRYARAKTLGYYYLPENIQRRIVKSSLSFGHCVIVANAGNQPVFQLITCVITFFLSCIHGKNYLIAKSGKCSNCKFKAVGVELIINNFTDIAVYAVNEYRLNHCNCVAIQCNIIIGSYHSHIF